MVCSNCGEAGHNKSTCSKSKDSALQKCEAKLHKLQEKAEKKQPYRHTTNKDVKKFFGIIGGRKRRSYY